MIRDQLISNRQYSQGLVLQNLAIFFGVELIFHVELQKIHIREWMKHVIFVYLCHFCWSFSDFLPKAMEPWTIPEPGLRGPS